MRWRRIMDFLRDEPPAPVTVSATEAERTAYAVGLAQGELRGRMALAAELEQEFGRELEDFTAQDATQVMVRQVH